MVYSITPPRHGPKPSKFSEWSQAVDRFIVNNEDNWIRECPKIRWKKLIYIIRLETCLTQFYCREISFHEILPNFCPLENSIQLEKKNIWDHFGSTVSLLQTWKMILKNPLDDVQTLDIIFNYVWWWHAMSLFVFFW